MSTTRVRLRLTGTAVVVLGAIVLVACGGGAHHSAASRAHPQSLTTATAVGGSSLPFTNGPDLGLLRQLGRLCPAFAANVDLSQAPTDLAARLGIEQRRLRALAGRLGHVRRVGVDTRDQLSLLREVLLDEVALDVRMRADAASGDQEDLTIGKHQHAVNVSARRMLASGLSARCLSGG